MHGHTQTWRCLYATQPCRVILYYAFFRTEVSKRGPGGLVSCRVQLQPLSNTPETANLSIVETFRQVCWGKLELNSAGHRPSRTEFGHLALEQVTNSRMGTCWFFLLMLLVICNICNIFHWQPRMWLLHYNINARNVKLHFSLCDLSEIAKPKISSWVPS